MITKIRNAILAAGLIFSLVALIAPPSKAATLSTAVIGMFPKETGEFAYADLKSARKLPWFGQLRDQMLPAKFHQFEQFLTSAGIDPNSQVDELAWGSLTATKDTGEQILGVALGQFDPIATEDRFKQQKLPFREVHGYKLYAFGSGSGSGDIFFFFLDSSTAAFGMRSGLEKMIDVHFGSTESLLHNDSLFPLISEANGSGMIWAVLNKTYTRMAMQQLLPQANQFPQAAALVQKISAMIIEVKADSGVDANFNAICASPDDANTLAALLQAGVMYRRYQEAQQNPDLAQALDGVQVTPHGDRLQIHVPVSDVQMAALLKNHTFAIPAS